MPDGAEAPTVIAIMNETFSDLSRYPGLAGTDRVPPTYYDIAAERSEAGDAYASALGGARATASSVPHRDRAWGTSAAACAPYVLYDLDGTESLVSYFSSLGYATHAVHPPEHELASRPRVRAAGLRRVRRPAGVRERRHAAQAHHRRATYDYVLDLLETDEARSSCST
ncbi:MAG: hypothetical protein ACLT98_12265 [Eggerthellaceae bacterium]